MSYSHRNHTTGTCLGKIHGLGAFYITEWGLRTEETPKYPVFLDHFILGLLYLGSIKRTKNKGIYVSLKEQPIGQP